MADQRLNHILRSVITAGNLMALHIQAPPGGIDHSVVNAWDAALKTLRTTIRTCEVCGTLDHHIVDGACPTCQKHIQKLS